MFYLSESVVVINDCKLYNDVNNWWVHIRVQGSGRAGWVYNPYIYNWSNTGYCQTP